MNAGPSSAPSGHLLPSEEGEDDGIEYRLVDNVTGNRARQLWPVKPAPSGTIRIGAVDHAGMDSATIVGAPQR